MRVLAGTLTDKDRRILFESNRSRRRVLVHTAHACPLDGRGPCVEHVCLVGFVGWWDRERFHLSHMSGPHTSIPWESARIVRWRDEVDDPERCPVATCESNLRQLFAGEQR